MHGEEARVLATRRPISRMGEEGYGVGGGIGGGNGRRREGREVKDRQARLSGGRDLQDGHQRSRRGFGGCGPGVGEADRQGVRAAFEVEGSWCELVGVA